MRDRLQRVWRAWLLALVAGVVWGMQSLDLSGGVWVYPLDDVYIEMALANSLITTGTWGVWPGEFTGVSSSLIWPIVLAPGELLGRLSWWPLLMAGACVTWLLGMVADTLHRSGASRGWQTGVPIALVVVTPVVPVAVTGMEHVLQAATGWLLLWTVARTCEGDTGARAPWTVGALAAVVVAVRFDAASLVIAAVGVTMALRQWRVALALVCGGVAPFVMYALVSSMAGWPWLPSSIVVKSRASGLLVWGDLSWWQALKAPLGMVVRSPQLLVPVIAALVCACLPVSRAIRAALVMCVAGLVIQLAVADGAMPAMFRYDAYLILLLVATIAVAVWHQQRVWLTAACALALLPLGQYTLQTARQALVDVQWHVSAVRPLAQLLEAHDLGPYPAVHDLGDVSYRTRRPVLDLDALATPDVLRAVRDADWNATTFARLAARLGTRVAAVTPGPGFRSPIPPQWIEVGSWMYEAEPAYVFYAPDPAAAREVQRALIVFAPQLPRSTTLVLVS